MDSRVLALALALRAPLLVAALVLAGCSASIASEPRRRAVVIGIDGADWNLIDAFVAEGVMPHMAALRERGVWGRIETLHDIPLSPVIWTSVATGKSAAKHGISWFMVDRPDGTRVPVRSHNRKTKALWNILADNGRRSATVGWWATYPAEDVGQGAMVSDALGFHGFGATARGGDDARKTHPPALFEDVDPLVPPEQQVSAEFAQRFMHLSADEYRKERFDPGQHPRRNPLNPIHLFQQYAVTAQGYAAIAEELLATREDDLFMLYFEQVDSFSHLFMKYAAPRLDWIDQREFERYRDVVREWYIYQDELLGQVLAHIDLEETAVFLLSDHGFKSGKRRIRSEETVDIRKAHLDHETRGIFLAAGPHVRAGGSEIEGASVLDITPTVLHYLGLPVGKDMDGKVLDELFEPDFRERHPIRYVSSHEDGPRPAGVGTGDGSYDAELLAQNESALRALGYTGDDSEGATATGAEGASSPEMHNNLGRTHLRNGEKDAALEEFEAALALDPMNANALLNIGLVRRAEGKVDQARHLVQRALQVDPNSVGALAALADIQRDQGDLDDALRLFREALAIDDSQPALYLGLGDVLQRGGRLQEAERAFHRVLELEPDSFRARYNLGVTRANQARMDEAAAFYEQALEVAPEHPEAVLALNNLGAIYLGRGESERALEHFERAVKSSRAHIESRFNTAVLYLERKRVEEAIVLLEEASALQPNSEQVHLELGMAYLAQGRGEDAYKSLLLVRRVAPHDWGAALGLSVLHARVGEMEKSSEFLGEALKSGGDTARTAAERHLVLRPLLDEAAAPGEDRTSSARLLR